MLLLHGGGVRMGIIFPPFDFGGIFYSYPWCRRLRTMIMSAAF